MDPHDLNALGMEMEDAGRFTEAEEAYRRASEDAPEWFAPWFNLGLICKILQRWEESARCNARALECDPTCKPAYWNLGIAATALGDWALARKAWRGYGVENVPDGNGPLDMRLGLVPIRLDPEGVGEVVWCDRLDPARALIRSVPRARRTRRTLTNSRPGNPGIASESPHGHWRRHRAYLWNGRAPRRPARSWRFEADREAWRASPRGGCVIARVVIPPICAMEPSTLMRPRPRGPWVLR